MHTRLMSERNPPGTSLGSSGYLWRNLQKWYMGTVSKPISITVTQQLLAPVGKIKTCMQYLCAAARTSTPATASILVGAWLSLVMDSGYVGGRKVAWCPVFVEAQNPPTRSWDIVYHCYTNHCELTGFSNLKMHANNHLCGNDAEEASSSLFSGISHAFVCCAVA